ncbi:hypothetical protein RQP46_008255 [Phenoliferia psychrophenolica]
MDPHRQMDYFGTVFNADCDIRHPLFNFELQVLNTPEIYSAQKEAKELATKLEEGAERVIAEIGREVRATVKSGRWRSTGVDEQSYVDVLMRTLGIGKDELVEESRSLDEHWTIVADELAKALEVEVAKLKTRNFKPTPPELQDLARRVAERLYAVELAVEARLEAAVDVFEGLVGRAADAVREHKDLSCLTN